MGIEPTIHKLNICIVAVSVLIKIYFNNATIPPCFGRITFPSFVPNDLPPYTLVPQQISFNRRTCNTLVAGTRFELVSCGYEPHKEPLLQPAISWVLLKRAPSAERRGKNQILTV